MGMLMHAAQPFSTSEPRGLGGCVMLLLVAADVCLPDMLGPQRHLQHRLHQQRPCHGRWNHL